MINDLSAPKGGATALAVASALAFAGRGLAVTFLAGDGGDNAALPAAGVDVHALGQARLTAAPFARALLAGLYNAAAARMVTDWIARNDTPATVYHVHGWAQILSPSLFRALRPVMDRVLLSAHDFFLVCPNGAFADLPTGAPCRRTPLSPACLAARCDRDGYAQKTWRVARQIVHRTLFDRAGSPPVLAIHERMRPLLIRGGIPDAAIRTLPNPVTPFSRERILAEDNRDVLFVGRLETTKGADLAAEACRRAGVRLRLIGDGAMRAELARRYPEMLFAGHQPPAAVAAHAASARMLLMPSRYPEPFGLVAAEAAWSGLPVIVPATAFLAPDLVAAGAGLAVDPQDVNALASMIRRLSQDDGLCRKMSVAAFAGTGRIALTPDAWADRLLALYEARLAAAPLPAT